MPFVENLLQRFLVIDILHINNECVSEDFACLVLNSLSCLKYLKYLLFIWVLRNNFSKKNLPPVFIFLFFIAIRRNNSLEVS